MITRELRAGTGAAFNQRGKLIEKNVGGSLIWIEYQLKALQQLAQAD
ncbi:hypothetical protein JMUB7504_27110 [Staphylococcus aureus]